MKRQIPFSIAGALAAILTAGSGRAFGVSDPATHWQAAAEWHRFPKRAVSGTLLIDNGGVEFRSAKFTGRWTYVGIHTFDLSARGLTLTSYEVRPWHAPGERRYRFTFIEPIPAAVAAAMTARVGKPVRNGVPVEDGPALAEIPAHLRARFGGSNGTLRLKDEGIDYVTEDARDSRSWRWADIQTIANPDPYELRVTAYREIAEFELKQPLSRAIFERLWDRLYAVNLNLSAAKGAGR